MVRIRITVRVRFNVLLVSCYAHVFVLLLVVITGCNCHTAVLASIEYLSKLRLFNIYFMLAIVVVMLYA